uniref:Uncharacterized protein n=1 Tax=Plectus sambesii TaxID=2011161 RepID=A0A914VK49_9BILA
MRPPSSLSSSSSSTSFSLAVGLAQIARVFCNYIVEPGIMSEHEEKLIIDKFRGYNHLIRPVLRANSTPIVVNFGLAMILLINVDEKNQIMQTNVWLTLRWEDYQMSWDPKDYGGITTLRVPPDKVWVPDIVLFNNADGHYEVSFHSNVVIEYTGQMLWVPPAIYKSSCRIDVEYFPFDEQVCMMIFGSWTYNSREVRLDWYNQKAYVELNDYAYSGIWDVMDVPGELVKDSSKVEFRIVIRRKTLFYTVILIIPTVLMAFLSMMVFYLPADCSEKITLAISILLALVVFLLLVSKILPPTSDTIPLMAKYLLMTFVMNIITILMTVVIINVYFRSPTTHTMPDFVRQLFLHVLPRMLMMQRPERIRLWNGFFPEEYKASDLIDAGLVIPSMMATFVPFLRPQVEAKKKDRHHPNCPVTKEGNPLYESPYDPTLTQWLSTETTSAIEAIAYIAEHMKTDIEDKKVRDDWKYMAMVIDRLVLVTFFGVTLGGTVGIIFSAPNVFEFVDQQEVINRLTGRHLESIRLAYKRGESALLLRAGGAALRCATNRGGLASATGADGVSQASEDEERLIIDIFKGYNHLIRPVPNVTASSVEVSFSLAMILLINVDEKNQVMQTNVWLTMKWIDYQLRWDPNAYGKIQTIRVPPDKVWLPDIVLFNNADGNYEVSFYSNVVIEYTGQMLWVPPAIYKSSCTIDVEFFPFDEQICAMIFGSWTFNKDEVTIAYLQGKRQVELNDYSPSGIWDIMEVPGELILSKSKISYQIRIRRKTLFYTVILIIPTVLMAFLSMMVFYLPAEASEKITLAISILLALVVFLLLVSKILPPTSSTIPLMAKYLLLTFVMNIITILVTVIIINVYFRGPTTHLMPKWVRTIFLDQLPMFLLMKRPERPTDEDELNMLPAPASPEKKKSKRRKRSDSLLDVHANNNNAMGLTPVAPGEFIEMSQAQVHHPYCSLERERQRLLGNSESAVPALVRDSSADDDRERPEVDWVEAQISTEALNAIEAIEYITEHLRQDDLYKKIRDDWKYVAMVIDRLLLYIFFAVTVGGTLGILFSAPNVFDYVNQEAVIAALKAAADED